jgi:tetratricopeptide (TPR) repeat protein
MEGRITQLGQEVRDILPPLQDILSLSVEDEAYLKLDPKQRRDRIFEAIRDLLLRESENKPLVLAVEDLHWIDKTSEEFLDYLIGWMANANILLVLLYRPEYTHPWGSKSYYNRIGLDQLTTASSAELVRAVLEGGQIAPELNEVILNRAAGNPLFMEEFTHALLENGSIERRDEQYVLSKDPSEIAVPDTIQGIIAARMDRLEDNLKRTVQVASVVGRDFAFRILQSITGMREELKAHLLNLQGLEFIYEKRLFPELEYVFKHALTQEVAYNSLLRKKRKEIHEKIANAIEEIYVDRLQEFYEMLAYHYVKAEDSEKAIRYLKLSGGKAGANYSAPESLGFYREALRVLTQMPKNGESKREEIEVRLLMAGPMAHLGLPDGSLENFQEGERLSRELGDEKGLAHFLSLIGQCYAWRGGDLLLAMQYSKDSFEEAEKTNDIELMAPIGYDLAMVYWWMGEYTKVIDVASDIMTMIEETQRQTAFFGRPYNVYCMLLSRRTASLWRTGDFQKGDALINKGLNLALEVKDLFSLGTLEMDYGWNFGLTGDPRVAMEHCQQSIKYCEEGKIVPLIPLAWMGLGLAYYVLGELDTASEYYEKGLRIQEEAGTVFDLGLFYALFGHIRLDLGELEGAQHLAEEGLRISQKNHEKGGECLVWILLGRVLGKGGEPQTEKAEECILQGIKIGEERRLKLYYLPGYLYLGELYADTDQKDKALGTLKKAGGIFRELGMDYWLVRTQEVMGKL